MRAGVAAPDAPGQHGDKEQAEGSDDQGGRDQDEILRPQGQGKQMDLAAAQVPEHRLLAVPVEPGSGKEQHDQQAGAAQAQAAKQPAETAGVNGAARLRGCQADWTLRVNGFDDPRGYAFAHAGSSIWL